MSEYCVQDFGLIGGDTRSHPKLMKKDSLETDAVPLTDDAKSKSKEMRRQFQPLFIKTNQTEHENDECTCSLCQELQQMQISLHSNGADDQHVQQTSVAQFKEQNYEPGSQTPDLLQHVNEREHGAGCHDVNGRCADAAGGACGGSGNTSEDMGYHSHQSEIEAKAHAIPFEDDYNQSASTTRQESLLPTTKPKGTVETAQTAQTAQQAQQVNVPHTPSPVEESTPPLLKPTNQEPPVEEEHYDILLLHSEHDQSEAEQFLDIAERANWKVTTSDDFLPIKTKFKSFESVFENSTYTVLLLTSNFVADVWCEHRYQTALTQSIENPLKRYSVIPIVCQDQNLKMPLALSIYTSVKLKNPKIEKILWKTIKVETRMQREKAAGLTTKDTAPKHADTLKEIVHPKDEKRSLSMDDIYHQQRPELQPGTSAAQIMSNHSFSKLCVYLDTTHPLENDWRKLALLLGFSTHFGVSALGQEKSPTAKILECFFEAEMGRLSSKSDILMKLTRVLMEMHRVDALQLLLVDGK